MYDEKPETQACERAEADTQLRYLVALEMQICSMIWMAQRMATQGDDK